MDFPKFAMVTEIIISHNNLYLASNDSIEDYYTSNKLEIQILVSDSGFALARKLLVVTANSF